MHRCKYVKDNNINSVLLRDPKVMNYSGRLSGVENVFMINKGIPSLGH